jgi:hypothetical protein
MLSSRASKSNLSLSRSDSGNFPGLDSTSESASHTKKRAKVYIAAFYSEEKKTSFSGVFVVFLPMPNQDQPIISAVIQSKDPRKSEIMEDWNKSRATKSKTWEKHGEFVFAELRDGIIGEIKAMAHDRSMRERSAKEAKRRLKSMSLAKIGSDKKMFLYSRQMRVEMSPDDNLTSTELSGSHN